uniref:Uncharacterized protein n=1 Tax=viral metagenome TaxID=1070528 RepID=A0A6C0JG58_9ZZZZ
MENITRIVDLPDITSGPSNTISQQQPVGQGTYVPINIHANPYGISAQNPIMAPPQQQHLQQQLPQISENQKMQLQQLQQQRLPSRDIPNDQSHYNHDEQITPNYIPQPVKKSDYVREHEDMTEKNLRDYEEKNRKEKKLDILLTEFQTPIFVMLLFFFFQLPIVNTMIFKKLSFLSIYNSDGNFNFSGLIFKSVVFGGLYYSLLKFTNFVSEI